MNDITSPYTARKVLSVTDMNGPSGAPCHTGRTDGQVVAAAGRGPQYQRQLIDQGDREQTSVHDLYKQLTRGYCCVIEL